MIHARPDYNRIQDPANPETNPEVTAQDWQAWGMNPSATPIGKDEPVFLLRAQDKHFLAAVEAYGNLVAEDETMDESERKKIVAACIVQASRAALWQAENGCKSPDL